MSPRQCVTIDEAVPALGQHTKPCSDCPWTRTALAGWLGGTTAEEWVREAHADEVIACHTQVGAQCAGAAIYRANVAKKPRNRLALQLPRDREYVFSTPEEFTSHHQKPPRFP